MKPRVIKKTILCVSIYLALGNGITVQAAPRPLDQVTSIAKKTKEAVKNLFNRNIKPIFELQKTLETIEPKNTLSKKLLEKLKLYLAAFITALKKTKEFGLTQKSQIEKHLLQAFNSFGKHIAALAVDIRKSDAANAHEIAAMIEKMPVEIENSFKNKVNNPIKKILFGKFMHTFSSKS